jgi:hypothetical protein
MPIKRHGIIAETIDEARQAKCNPTALALLTTPSEAKVKHHLHEQSLSVIDSG